MTTLMMQNVKTYAPLPTDYCAAYRYPGEYLTIEESMSSDLFAMELDYSKVVASDHELTVDFSNVTRRHWYHGTHRKSWHKAVLADEMMVHLGSLDSAVHRVTSKHTELDDMNFFEITLNPERLKLLHSVGDDFNYQEVTPIEEARKDYDATSDENAFLYWNEWEIPGSLSLHMLSSAIEYIRPMKLEEVL